MSGATTKPASWKCPPVHPAAARLPMMSDAEIDEHARDIDANGLKEPLVIWIDNHDEPKGAKGPFPEFFLDGRNRLEALKRIGINDPYSARPAGVFHLGVTKVAAFKRHGALSLDDRTVSGRWEPWVGYRSVREGALDFLPIITLDPWRGDAPMILTESRSLAGVLRHVVWKYRARIA